jgi:hypothetical protein
MAGVGYGAGLPLREIAIIFFNYIPLPKILNVLSTDKDGSLLRSSIIDNNAISSFCISFLTPGLKYLYLAYSWNSFTE